MKTGILWFLGLLCICTGAFAEDFPAAVEKPVEKSITIRQQTQKTEDQWAAEKATLEAQFEALKQKQDQLISLREDLKKQVRSHEETVRSLETKISEISGISSGLRPFLEALFNRLSERIESDLPFLRNERRERIMNLRKTLEDTQVSESEKFRKLMEAVFIEAEYGNTVEVYQERIEVSGSDILANIFRLGRVSLFFQSLDQSQTGYFDPAQFSWKPLPEAFNRDINAAIEMGTKRRSVDLIQLPVGRIVLK